MGVVVLLGFIGLVIGSFYLQIKDPYESLSTPWTFMDLRDDFEGSTERHKKEERK
mgnify:CR=1 FL=1